MAHFLRGPRESVPDVQVCWRADIDLTGADAQDDAIESLTLCPPGSSETLPVPIGVFKRWLAGKDADDFSADVECARTADRPEEDSEDVEDSNLSDRRVIRWRGTGTNDKNVTSDPVDIRPGDVIVIPCTHRPA